MDLFVKQRIPTIYNQIQYWNNELTLYKRPEDDEPIGPMHSYHSISLLPDYLKTTLSNAYTYVSKRYDQTNLGYAILLENGFEIDTYLKLQFGNNYRNIKKRHLRLESCFDINYAFFHGTLDEDKYQILMKSLHGMLTRRFEQRGEINEKLLEWDKFLGATYSQICDKKASLFVIYDHDQPIDISINYHFHKIMFGAVSSYDIDYYKFGLGTIEKIKLLEWCLANDYKILEFGYGDLEYKRLWSNYSYRFKYEVIFNPKSIVSKTFAKIELIRLFSKEYLKSKKIDVYIRKAKAVKIFGRARHSFKDTPLEYESTSVPSLQDFGELNNIGNGQTHPEALKSVLNNFLYTSMENKNDVVVSEVVEQPGTYLLSGKKNFQKIIFKNRDAI